MPSMRNTRHKHTNDSQHLHRLVETHHLILKFSTFFRNQETVVNAIYQAILNPEKESLLQKAVN